MPRRERSDVLRAVEALYALQLRPIEIAKQVSAQFSGPEAAARGLVPIGERQVLRYVEKHEKVLASESEKTPIAVRRNRLRQSYNMVFQKAIKLNDLKAAVAALDKLAKLDGLNEPDRAEISHTVDLSKMTSGDKRDRLEALLQRARELEAIEVRARNANGNGHALEDDDGEFSALPPVTARDIIDGTAEERQALNGESGANGANGANGKGANGRRRIG